MRPLLLELHGFGPFREPTTIDFRDHDLIAFTGPTGAGKSTIIDGIAFALYGSVARYENEKLVAPIINAVSTEARVRLDFAVGESTYTAVRVVRRAGTGASTKEARLESGNEVLASNAQEVTSKVEGIVGLSFSQFTKTIVLPQGDFAQFLNVKPSVRQGLLRRMLGLDLYANVGKTARLRSRDIKTQMAAFEQTMDDQSSISERKLEQLRTSLVKLEDELEKVEAATEDHQTAIDQLDELTASVNTLDEQIVSLEALEIPADTKSFASRVDKARAAMTSAESKMSAAAEKHDALTEARADLPTEDELSDLIEQHEAHAKLTAQIAELTAAQKSAASALAKAAASAEGARTALGDAETALEHARTLAGAEGIAATLHVGDDCPVCAQLIESLPTGSSGKRAAALAKAEAARDAARSQAQEVVHVVQGATAAETEATTRLEAAEGDAASITADLADQPTLKQTLALQKKADAANAKIEAANDKLLAATALFDEATATFEESSTSESAMRREFTAARDSVSELQPPTPSEEAVHEDWLALTSWGKERAKELRTEVRGLRKEQTAAEKAKAKAEKSLARIAMPYFPPNAAVDPLRAGPMVRNAHADARLAFANAEDRWMRQKAIKEQLSDLENQRALSEELGKHLMSGMFERWILTDVMEDLAERASLRLLALSDGAFSLMTDGRDFQIRDHRNADEIRSSRTLSGGETFLTSLSLALALADSITDLAATSTPPLGSMFLDEGFGTLDAETLDVVATAIEDLGASGRLIGIVTHIPDLAERIPARVEVQPTPTGSIVVTP